jgi:DNA-binding beta-propeller fold protein YncE
MLKPLWFVLVIGILIGCNTSGQNAPPDDVANRYLKPAQTIALPNVEGRFDHFAADARRNRLFVAALGNDTLEVIDTDALKIAGHITGLHKPQGVAFIPNSGGIAVASGGDGMLRFYDAATLKPGPVINGLDDADNVRYDDDAKRLYVGYGGGALAVIDPSNAQKVADIKLDGHPESFQLERSGKRIFVNVPEASHVAVVDCEKQTVIAKWSIGDAKANFPMALDEANHRLFVGCRSPAKLVVLDTQSGKLVASIDVVGDTDDLFYDTANKRIYVSGGSGAITVVEQAAADSYRAVAQVKTAQGARTCFFMPETQTLYLAVPHRGAQQSELRIFKTASTRN